MSSFRLIYCAVLLAFLFSPLANAEQSESANEGEVDVKKTAQTFLKNYCLDCHDNETREGNVSLQNLSDVSADNASMWKRVWEQVALKEMPPREETNQPKLLQRLEISNWITAGLTKALKNKGGYNDHLRPSKGNHIAHDLLFGGELKNAEHNNLEPQGQRALWGK